MIVDEDAPGRSQEEAGRYEVWWLPDAVEYADKIDCGGDATGGAVGSEVVSTKDGWSISNHLRGPFRHKLGTTASIIAGKKSVLFCDG